MSRRHFLQTSVAACGALLAAPTAWAAGEDLVVVANPRSGVTCLDVNELYAIFTLSKRHWQNGKRIVAFNFPPKHEHRTQFDKAVLNLTHEAAAKYWIDQRIRGGNAPPKHVPSSGLMARVIAELEGSIGYLPKGYTPEGSVVVALIQGGLFRPAPACK